MANNVAMACALFGLFVGLFIGTLIGMRFAFSKISEVVFAMFYALRKEEELKDVLFDESRTPEKA